MGNTGLKIEGYEEKRGETENLNQKGCGWNKGTCSAGVYLHVVLVEHYVLVGDKDASSHSSFPSTQLLGSMTAQS